MENEDGLKISNVLNNMAFRAKETAQMLANEHPTLQQSFMRLCIAFIKIQAEKDLKRNDLRNEASIKTSKKIVEALDSIDLLMPFI
jgi:hypothetical protein